ncbi:kinase-like protein [Hypoxylon sp. FL1857]|nr:kinase-like protein [Hypoxylon sp. FL1857]
MSDFWIPMPKDIYPRVLNPSDYPKFDKIQSQFLAKNFSVGHQDDWPGEHFNLSPDAMNQDTDMPRSLEYGTTVGGSSNTDVAEVKYSGASFALKRIQRMKTYDDELEQMNYINGEIRVLRKIRSSHIRHFIRLVASYTDIQYIGMLLTPVADCNLGTFLDDFHASERPDVQLLEGFFGCLATALAHLHYDINVRHKDIKPQNILVKKNKVLFTDFGISLDWSRYGCTTTQQEKRRTYTYCAPEVAREEPRNSKSDIWSLGCVFLEMFAVLKGKPRSYLHQTLGRQGQPRFCHSEEGVAELVAGLRESKSQYGNEPLQWIEKMLQWSKDGRPNAMELRHEILQSEKVSYCGLCCRRVTIFREGQSNGIPGNQGALGNNHPHASEPFSARIFVPVGRGHWEDISVIQDDSLSRNWISPSVAAQAKFRLYNNVATESITLGEKEFKSNQYARATWTIKKAAKTLEQDFLVATDETPFKMLVVKASADLLRASVPKKTK